METGFVKGNTYNLPKMDTLMVARYVIGNKDLFATEFKKSKKTISSKESYGDNAIGYVQLKRDSDLCIVKCKVCPGYKPYLVTIIVDEKNEDVISSRCHSCGTLAGGCVHAFAFLLWLHRRSEEPSYGHAECYWRKSQPLNIGSTLKFITATELANENPSTSSDSRVFEQFVQQAAKKNCNCELLKYLHHTTLDS